jgi:hypothetical protein
MVLLWPLLLIPPASPAALLLALLLPLLLLLLLLQQQTRWQAKGRARSVMMHAKTAAPAAAQPQQMPAVVAGI